MTDKDPSKFRIRLDDDILDSTLQGDVEDLRITKLGRRITLIAIFIPCVVGAVLFFAYLDLNKRVGKVHVTGTAEVQNVSKDLESRISTLAYEFSSSKESLTKQIASIESNLKEATTAIKYIRSARKTDNKKFKGQLTEIESQLTEIENKLTPIRKSLDLVISEIKNFDKKVARELVQLTNTVQKTNNDLKKNISFLSSSKISKKAFDLAMIDQQVRLQEKLNQVTARFEKKLETARKKIAKLEKAQALYKKSKTMQPIIPPRTPPAPEKEAGTPKSEPIIEQDIQ